MNYKLTCGECGVQKTYSSNKGSHYSQKIQHGKVSAYLRRFLSFDCHECQAEMWVTYLHDIPLDITP